MDYQGAQRPGITKRDVEPLGLVYYSDNWHLIGYCRLRCDVRDFRTDRIRQVQVRNELFSGHDDFSLKRYLEAAANDGKFETALVKFSQDVIERVRREWSCRLVEEKAVTDGVVVTLLAYSLEWLAPWILSFGSRAQVVAPQKLVHMVAAEAREIAGKYHVPERPGLVAASLESLVI